MKLQKIAIFLDRDGVINRDPGDGNYVRSWREFRFIPRTKRAIALLNKKNFPLFIISNQAGISKGIYTRDALNVITNNMLAELKKVNARIEGIYYCTHRDEDNCSCRKPKTGLIKLALGRRNLNLEKSFFIGDTIRDIKTARAAGCKSVLVLSGKERLANQKKWEIKPDFVFADLYEASRFILNIT